MRKRGAEMSMNLIILIVIALIVAAIIIYLVASNAHRADEDITGCQAKGGTCQVLNGECPSGTSGSTFFTKGCGDGEKCCMPAGGG